MESLERILAAHPFFQNLDARHLQLIVGCATNRRFAPGEYLHRDGDLANQFYLLRQGRVALEIFAPDRGPLVTQTFGEGEVLGWSWLFPPYRWHDDARVLELTRALVFDGTCLRKKCEQDHHLGYELMKRFSQSLLQELKAARVQLLDVYGDVARS